ncbi:MAG: 50S ribosomal protein L4 [Clostridia bacterium]|nr:50S ribosomal protein L4 [Clostridia bacterium]
MPVVDLYNMTAQKVGEVDLNDSIFGTEINEKLMHQVVKMQLANKRQGTHSTKTRGEVRGGGAKPWRQKGTGRARHGSIRSPIWVKGGITFGPKPRDYSYDMPKKMKRQALKSALSSKVMNNNFVVIDQLDFEQPKTKEMKKVLDSFNIDKKVLLVIDKSQTNVMLSSRNIQGVKIAYVNTLNVLDILSYDKFMVTKSVVDKIEEVYA